VNDVLNSLILYVLQQERQMVRSKLLVQLLFHAKTLHLIHH